MSRWIERTADAEAVAGLVAAGQTPLMARLLALRGVTADTLAHYLSPDWRDLAAPDELPGVSGAVPVILDALRAGERIVVFGDYDCDGVCATAILTLALRRLAAALAPGGSGEAARRVAPFLPDRLGEGYGLTDASVARMLREVPDVRLVVTVDNGINAVEQIDALNARGIRVVVTDHHLRGEALPRAAALVNPKVSAPPHLADLCGAAVAYFLATALVAAVREATGDAGVAKGLGGALFTLAGLATVTDIMPLAEQNRILVAESLRHFPRWAPVGLRELHARAARTGAEAMSARDFGFVLGPRINAVGRLGSGADALSLLLCPECERERSRSLAMAIDLCNTRRRSLEQRMTEAASAQVAPGAAAQVIAFAADNPDVHAGVAGIVASRLMERLSPSVPVCVLVGGKGSSRAPAGYNVRDALAACAESLLNFGGHAAAAGLAVRDGALEAFRAAFAAACAAQAATLSLPEPGTRFVDAVVAPRDVTLGLAEAVARMEPFGEGNPEPVFALRGVAFASGGIRPLGREGQHLQLAFRERGLPRAVWWGRGDAVEELRANGLRPHDVMFTLVLSDYGARHVEMSVVDVQPSAG